jgi:hypothetical protein
MSESQMTTRKRISRLTARLTPSLLIPKTASLGERLEHRSAHPSRARP